MNPCGAVPGAVKKTAGVSTGMCSPSQNRENTSAQSASSRIGHEISTLAVSISSDFPLMKYPG